MSGDRQPVYPEGAPLGGVFAGRYRIERLLGEGGMGYVLGALDEATGERVALKLLLPEHAKNKTIVARFLREMRASRGIRSEHVARIIDAGDEGGTPFIVMEWLEGTDLGDLLARESRLPVARAIDAVLQACEALAEAHAVGTIHRDLKPTNLFLTRTSDGRDVVKVLDFGIARLAQSESVALTTTTAAAGTPLYMSPEQLRSMRDVDARTDIWAIGAVLFELLAGQPPFVANTVAEIGAKVLAGTAPDVRSYARAVPDGVANAIARCLRRDPDERFPSLAEMANALAPFGSGEAEVSRGHIERALAGVPRPRAVEPPPLSSPVAIDPVLAETQPDARRTTAAQWKDSTIAVAPSRRRPRVIVMLAVLAGVVIGVGAWFVSPTFKVRDSVSPEASAASAAAGAVPSASATSPRALVAPETATPPLPPASAPSTSASVSAPTSTRAATPRRARPAAPAASASASHQANGFSDKRFE